MALGTLGIGALLLGGGLAANSYVQKSRADDIGRGTTRILNNAKDKQAELDEQRQQTLGQALNEAAVGRGEVEAAQAKEVEKGVARMEANSNRPEPTDNDANSAGMDGPAGRVIGKAVDRERQANDAENSQRRTAMAKMDSLGDVLAGNNRIFRPAQGEIQANQQIARGEEARIPLAVQAVQEKAMNSKRALEIGGQLAQGVGSGLLAGGGSWMAPTGAAGGAGSAVAASGAGSGVAGASTGAKISRAPMIVY
jgi:hypothetical protein